MRKVATVFDPLGLVSPFVIKTKVLLQETWSRGYDWDDDICDEVAVRIGGWHERLRSLTNVLVPRCLREAKEVVDKRVAAFVDISLQAYGTAIYLQCVYSDGTTSSQLIASNSKMAPLKPMTVPRLPMQVVTFYLDRMDVLWWARGHGRGFRAFVANRIGEFQMVTQPSQWQHVATTDLQMIFVQEERHQTS